MSETNENKADAPQPSAIVSDSCNRKTDSQLRISVAEKLLETKLAIAQTRREQVTDHENRLVALQLKIKGVETDLKASNDDDEIWAYHQRLLSELVPLETELGPNKLRIQLAEEAVAEAKQAVFRAKVEDARARASGRNLIRSCKRDLQHCAELVDELVATIDRMDRRHREAQNAWKEAVLLRPDLRVRPDGTPREPHLVDVIGRREMRALVASAIGVRGTRNPKDVPGWICEDIVLDLSQKNMPPPENANYLSDSLKHLKQMVMEEFEDG